MEKVALFIAGFAAGIACYRDFITRVLRSPRTACDFCEYERQRNELFPKRK